MHRSIARLAAAGLVALSLSLGAAPGNAAATAKDTVACQQAQAQFAAAKAKHDRWVKRLGQARKQLHQAHAHGTQAEFQQAKNHVRRVKAKIYEFQKQMNEAAAQEALVC